MSTRVTVLAGGFGASHLMGPFATLKLWLDYDPAHVKVAVRGHLPAQTADWSALGLGDRPPPAARSSITCATDSRAAPEGGSRCRWGPNAARV